MQSVQLTRRRLSWLLCAMPLLASCSKQPSASVQPVKYVDLLVETDGDLLAFKQTELSCRTGDHVRLTFRHTGKYISFNHNWVLILPGTFDAFVKAASAAGEESGWMPPHDPSVLAATKLCGKGETAVIEFIAPAPGDYLYICSTPGHGESMWGVLHVTAA
jgi:azurin